MKNTTRMNRLLRYRAPHRLEGFPQEAGLWYESPQEAAETERRYKLREKRMAWVRAAMLLELTARERECVTLHYLESMHFRAIAHALGIHHSAAHRNCQRGIQKLRAAAQRREGRTGCP